ncbi:MAG: NUDIX domain-containing protein [Lactobacillaceae bacterium]|jgi:isopentenyldiphosphate isomerase|nr:NUDIX domain-containing protein [Lactobacillaceae bacterium]
MTEFIDILDENGNPTGESMDGKRAHELHLWHNAAYIWIINSAGELLLQLRAPSKRLMPNWWDISAAGHVKAGETVIDGALRELNEELGVKALPEDLVKLSMTKIGKFELFGETHISNSFHNGFLLKLDWTVERFALSSREVAAVKFFPWRSLAKLSERELMEQRIVPQPEYKELFKYLNSIKCANE